MQISSKKLGFWPVFAIVTGSQIGSGVFILPASLAPFGMMSLWGWVISGLGAIALALVFAALCKRVPKTGGPHAYLNHAFGPIAAFFTGWTYWVISWVSTTAVIVGCVGYLTPIIGNCSPYTTLGLQISILLMMTSLNIKGVVAAGKAEILLTIMKFIPLIILPGLALALFNKDNFVVSASVAQVPTCSSLAQVTLLTLWGFVGVESATAPAGSVINPKKTIPKAITLGTICVAMLYLFNSFGLMGLISGTELMNSKAPYSDAAQIIFGGQWNLVISLMAAIVCIGTLNAWILTSGQIALGLSQDGFFPKFFGKKNTNGAPFCGILISAGGILPLLVLTANDNLVGQIASIIDISVIAFLFVYFACCIALLKFLLNEHNRSFFSYLIVLIAIGFCGWVIAETPSKTLLTAGLFTLSGIPMYLLRRKEFASA